MKLCHIVKYHDVFLKIDYSPYRTMLSAIMALCLLKFTVLNDVCSLRWIVLIRILWNLGQIVKYQDVFFKLYNGLYGTML